MITSFYDKKKVKENFKFKEIISSENDRRIFKLKQFTNIIFF